MSTYLMDICSLFCQGVYQWPNFKDVLSNKQQMLLCSHKTYSILHFGAFQLQSSAKIHKNLVDYDLIKKHSFMGLLKNRQVSCVISTFSAYCAEQFCQNPAKCRKTRQISLFFDIKNETFYRLPTQKPYPFWTFSVFLKPKS